jgi:GTPase
MQFIDQAEVEVKAGDGGDGVVAFRREKYVPAGGPSGGNGGRGGSVILVADAGLQTLLDFRYKRLYKADNGQRGGNNNRTGASGKDLLIHVPCGTIIYELEPKPQFQHQPDFDSDDDFAYDSDDESDFEPDLEAEFAPGPGTERIIADLVSPGQTFTVAQGGKGGLGNHCFLTNYNRAPEQAYPGVPGEQRRLRLELKLLAEVGIIGLPNAGKSTLIAALSAARPKIADYPFTTLVPNLGVVRKPTGDGTVFADIPGLIEGAHMGVGLGHDFLRHVERTRVLLHLIDATSEDPIAAYQTIQQELHAYGRGLTDRPQILALTKLDAIDPELHDIAALSSQLQDLSQAPVFVISSATRQGLDALTNRVWQTLDAMTAAEQDAQISLPHTPPIDPVSLASAN